VDPGESLGLPQGQALLPHEVKEVYGYPRDLGEAFQVDARLLGAGSYGVVREAVCRATGEAVAVKSIPKIPKRVPLALRKLGYSRATTPRYLGKIQNEVDVLDTLNGSLNVVGMHGAFEDDAQVHMVMDVCRGGTIFDRLRAGRYTERQVANVLRSVLRMLAQCHSKGVIFMDVKADNFLYLTNDPSSVLKAIDFGLAQRFERGQVYSQRRGTPAYMSPELILQAYDEKCDVWSAGVLAWQLLHGRFPHTEDVTRMGLQEVWQRILKVEPDFSAAQWEGYSDDARDFLRALLQRDPKRRPSASSALDHPWLQAGADEQGAGGRDEGREKGVGGVALSKTAREEIKRLQPLQGNVVRRLQRFGTLSLMQQLVLTRLADRAPGLRESTELLRALDLESVDSIATEDLASLLKGAGYRLSDREALQLIRKLDVDRSGTVEVPELVSALADWEPAQKDERWDTWCREVFDELDADGSGTIDVDELVSALPDSFSGQRHVYARRILREVDSNGDGQISWTEFMEMLQGEELDLGQFDARI